AAAATRASGGTGPPAHPAALGVLPLDRGLHVAHLRDRVVDDLSLVCVHWVQPLGPPGAADPLRYPPSPGDQLGPATFAIVLDVDDHPAPRLQPSLNGPAHDLLKRVEGLAVASDQQAHAVALLAPDVDVHGSL